METQNFRSRPLAKRRVMAFVNGKIDEFCVSVLLGLPQPNVMKVINTANYHKTQIQFEFGWRHFYCSWVIKQRGVHHLSYMFLMPYTLPLFSSFKCRYIRFSGVDLKFWGKITTAWAFCGQISGSVVFTYSFSTHVLQEYS